MGPRAEYNVTCQVILNSGQTNISLSELLARLQATEDYIDVSEGTKATDDAAVIMAKAKKKFGKYNRSQNQSATFAASADTSPGTASTDTEVIQKMREVMRALR